MDNGLDYLELGADDVEDCPPIDELMETLCVDGVRLPESSVIDKGGSMNPTEQAEGGPAEWVGGPTSGRSASRKHWADISDDGNLDEKLDAD